MKFNPAAYALLGLSILSGCGKAEFQNAVVSNTQQAPATYEVPAKVDILLVKDDSGSTVPIYNELTAATKAFLNDLSGRGWDYRFASIPMTLTYDPETDPREMQIEQIVGSAYDGNYYPNWKEPYPGANPFDPMLRIGDDFFRTPESYSGFATAVNVFAGSSEPTFESIRWVLNHPSSAANGFVRPDALTAVVVIGNGDDNSGVNSCKRSDGRWVVCGPDMDNYQYNPPRKDNSYNTSLAFYKNEFAALKGSASRFKMFTAVANASSNNCKGSISLKGARYINMAQRFGTSTNVDICGSAPVTNVLSQLSGSLTSTRLDSLTRYASIGFKPDLGSPMKVVKHTASGDVQLKPDDANGYRYVGAVTESNGPFYFLEIESPNGEVSYNNQVPVGSYIIELLGNGIIRGTETVSIDAKQAKL